MRLLIDAQLPPRLAHRFRELGHEAIHVADVGLAEASDAVVWKAAVDREAVLVTKDQDFAIAKAVRGDGPSVIWIRIGNTSNEVLIARLINSLGAIAEAFARGDTIVEVVAK